MEIERTEINIGQFRFDVVSSNCVYVNLNGFNYYIDDSTNEQILKKWKERNEENE